DLLQKERKKPAQPPLQPEQLRKTSKTRRQKTDPEVEKTSENNDTEVQTQDASATTALNADTISPPAQEPTH
ncbi:10182_t:CDS:2, partial [Acaulospora colombiana]